jgi:hypothetical protein
VTRLRALVPLESRVVFGYNLASLPETSNQTPPLSSHSNNRTFAQEAPQTRRVLDNPPPLRQCLGSENTESLC